MRKFFSAGGGFAILSLICGLWLTEASATGAPPRALPAAGRKLIIISIDGLDSRFFRDADRLHIKIPNLHKMLANGISADVIGMAPGLSQPSYATIVTGTAPAVNGVIDDQNPGGVLRVMPIWRASQQKGLKSAAIYWPNTLDARLDFNCPQQNTTDFNQIAAKCTPGLIDRIAKWDNSFLAPLWDDAVGIDIMRFLLTNEKTDLILLHLAELGAEQRETGAMSLYARKVLENDDELLGVALQKAAPGTAVAIVSDHGYDTEQYVVRPKVMLKAAGLSDAVTVKYGLVGVRDARAAAILRKSISVPRSGIAREVPLTELRKLAPELRGWVAAFDTTLGYVANEEAHGLAISGGNHRGVAGFWPTHDSSRAVFVLTGPGVKHARLAEISILDEAPTLAEILGVKLVPARGTSVLTRVR